jgi:beta-phosphoglucomutase-like phosphatase (HAD superfamily)
MAAPPLALLLGCDGVLVLKPRQKEASRRAAHLAASREAAAAFGLAYSEADFERLAGVPAAEAFARLAAEQGRAGVDGAAVAAAKTRAQKRLSSGEPYAAALAFAQEAAAAGAQLAVACDNRRDHVTAVLAKLGMSAAVRTVMARDSAPDALARLTAAAAALGVPPARCHVLEANDGALAAAAAAGMSATDARTLPGYAAAAAAADGPPQPPPPPRLRGCVKSYSTIKHYGFITPAVRARVRDRRQDAPFLNFARVRVLCAGVLAGRERRRVCVPERNLPPRLPQPDGWGGG